MFEGFTDGARRVVVLALEEARTLDNNYVGTEHILLGLIRDGEGVAAVALESTGIGLAGARSQVELVVGRGGQAQLEPVPLTSRARGVLELSRREAEHLGHQDIGTGHILLGLMREGEGVAVQVLVKLGGNPTAVQQRVLAMLSGDQREQTATAEVRDSARRAGVTTEQPLEISHLRTEIARLRNLIGRHGIDPDSAENDYG